MSASNPIGLSSKPATIGLSSRPTANGLSKPAKIGIGVGVGVAAVLVATGVLLYFFVFSAGAPNNGPSKFGSIQVRDTTTNTQSKALAPGDSVELRYTPTDAGFSGRSAWLLSVDGGKTFSVSISDPSGANVVNWTIPATVFTQSGIFKVFDVDLPADFVVSDTYTIDPDMDLVTGPGVNRAGDVVFAGYSLTTVVSMDTGLSGLSSSSFAVSLSADPKFINGVVATSLVSATIASNRVTLVWSTSALQTGVFVRVSTTSLVASGYPYELTAVTANKISVVQGTSCSGLPNPNPLEFQVCAVTMTNSSGALGSFYPTEPVTIIFFYRNDAFPGTATLEYSVNGGSTYLSWSPTSGPVVADPSVSYGADLPAGAFTTEFVVRVTSGGSSAVSAAFTVESYITNDINPGTTFDVYQTASDPALTTVTLFPASYRPSQWSVGFSNLNGSGQQLFSAALQAPVTYSGSTALLSWALTWAELGVSAPQTLNRNAVFAADTVVTTSAPVYFLCSVHKAPTYSLCSPLASPAYNMRGNPPQPPFQFTTFGYGDTSVWGAEPDPNGSAHSIIHSPNTGYWLGPIVDAGQGFIFVASVTTQAEAALYDVLASVTTAGCVNLRSVEGGVYLLVQVGIISGLTLYPGPATPTTDCDLTWSGQV